MACPPTPTAGTLPTRTPSLSRSPKSDFLSLGKFVNGIAKSSQKKGYLCLESEGKEIHFRNIRILELAPGVTSPDQVAPEL